MTYVKVDYTLYPATIDGLITDYQWDGRESKAITLELSYAEVLALFSDGTPWKIVMTRMEGEIEKVDEFDNSDFEISGPITDNRDGTVTVKMGKPTDLELAYEAIYGEG